MRKSGARRGPGPAAARNSSFIFETVRLKSYPVTSGWPAREWLRGRVVVASLSLRCATASLWSLRDGLRRKELFFGPFTQHLPLQRASAPSGRAGLTWRRAYGAERWSHGLQRPTI